MFFKKKQEQPHKTYDHENKKPMIKASICNGEQVAGFKDVHTGTFEEVMLIRDSAIIFLPRIAISFTPGSLFLLKLKLSI